MCLRCLVVSKAAEKTCEEVLALHLKHPHPHGLVFIGISLDAMPAIPLTHVSFSDHLPSWEQAIEATTIMVLISRYAWFLMMKSQARREAELTGGPVTVEHPDQTCGEYIVWICMRLPAHLTEMGVFCYVLSVLLNGFHQPDWMKDARFSSTLQFPFFPFPPLRFSLDAYRGILFF